MKSHQSLFSSLISIRKKKSLIFSMELVLGYKPNEIIDQSIHRILPTECLDILEQAKQNCRMFIYLDN